MSTSASAVSFKRYGRSAAANYERYFAPVIGTPFARALPEVADLRRGERALDVACGTGAVTRLAAARVTGDGAVVGLGLNPLMIAVARTAVPDTRAELSVRPHRAILVPFGAERSPSTDPVLAARYGRYG